MENIWLNILSCIGGVAGVSSVFWTLINIKARKQIESANADLQTAQADRQVGDNWQQFANELENERNEYKQELSKVRKQLYKLSNRVTKIERARYKAEYAYCKRFDCSSREPAIGTYVSDISDNLNDEDDEY